MWTAIDPLLSVIGDFAQAGCGVANPNSVFYHIEFQMYLRL